MSGSNAYDCLAGSHDLRLSPWGAYTKRYMGISHIPDMAAGLRFDLSVFPALYRRETMVPNVRHESGFHMWEAAPDMSYVSVRYELLWKDRVYCDVAFARLDDDTVLIESRLVNDTALPYSLALHYMASMHFPPLRPYCDEELRMAQVDLPSGGVWIDGLAYESMHASVPDPRAALTCDGFIRGQIRDHGFTGGNGFLLGGFSGSAAAATGGEPVSATYSFTIPDAIPSAALLMRYRMPGGDTTRLAVTGAFDETVMLETTESFAVLQLATSALQAGTHAVTIASAADAEIQVDGLAVVPAGEAGAVHFEPVAWEHVPGRVCGPTPESIVLKYEQANTHYGVAWDFPQSQVRQFFCDDLDILMKRMVLDHVNETFRGTGNGHYTNVFLRPVFLEPHSSRTIYGVVCSGTEREDAMGRLQAVDLSAERCAPLMEKARANLCDLAPNPDGEPLRFSQERMAATILTNVVYPVHTRGTYIRHYSPGRWWDSLYTWDAGFVALGLADLDTQRAVDCLNCYVTEPGERDAAFIHHGSPVPVQLYAFLELFNRTGSMDLAAYFFPRLAQYHRFLAGRHGSSTTRNLASNLLRTWDYFYNSGGWDDYPPQMHVHKMKLTATVAPVSNTCHAIRTAKILRMAALALGADTQEFDDDIAMFTDAVQKHAWDAESGYFGYVCHGHSGRPEGILRTRSGLNFNMGFDGAYPLVAGICTPGQQETLCGFLMSDRHMWCPCGLSTVDQSAPYYRNDGYWNGAVWMPHQWFFWKALLGLGRADDAWKIASTALEIWRREVDESYHCFEHFMVQTGRGAGWHQFGALSSPVVNWYAAYHRPGSLNTGYDAWIERLEAAVDGKSLSARMALYGDEAHSPVAVAVVKPSGGYEATWDGADVPFMVRVPGTLEVVLPGGVTRGELVVRSR